MDSDGPFRHSGDDNYDDNDGGLAGHNPLGRIQPNTQAQGQAQDAPPSPPHQPQQSSQLPTSIPTSEQPCNFPKKISRAGGPVTCVAFGPTFGTTEPDVVFVAQGPYIVRYKNGNEMAVATSNEDDVNDNNKNSDDDNKNSDDDDRLLVFPMGGCTIHGIHFVDRPWEGPSKRPPMTREASAGRHWDAIVYGGTQLTFCRLLHYRSDPLPPRCSGLPRMERRTVRIILLDDNDNPSKNNTSNHNNYKSSNVVGGGDGPIGCSSSSSASFRSTSVLTTSDWIWTVKTMPHDDDDGNEAGGGGVSYRTGKGGGAVGGTGTKMIVGVAKHLLEVWNVVTVLTHDDEDENGAKNGTAGSGRNNDNIHNNNNQRIHDNNDQVKDDGIVILATRLRRLYLNPTITVTSMDVTFRNARSPLSSSSSSTTMMSVWIAAGTSFHTIWISSIQNDVLSGSTVERQQPKQENESNNDQTFDVETSCLVQPTFDGCNSICNNNNDDDRGNRTKWEYNDCLHGHAGVVHSVLFCDGHGDGHGEGPSRRMLVSTSDDRSVRVWAWDHKVGRYVSHWIGWGHTARVWRAVFVNVPVDPFQWDGHQHNHRPREFVVSVAEDGTARIWDALESSSSSSSSSTDRAAVACIQNGTGSSGIWTVDVNGGRIVLGSADGVATTYDILHHIGTWDGATNDDVDVGRLVIDPCVPVPDDRPKNDPDPDVVEEDDVDSPGPCLSVGGKRKMNKKKKKKEGAQVIVGMKWWSPPNATQGGGPKKLLLATRNGSHMVWDVQSRQWTYLDNWWDTSISKLADDGDSHEPISATDGCCMAVHDDGSVAMIGTTRGYVVVVPLIGGGRAPRLLLNGRRLKSVQSLTFLDSKYLVSFHVRSIALWDCSELVAQQTSPILPLHIIEPSLVFGMATKGVPLSCALDREHQRLVAGDSRGHLSLFCMPTTSNLPVATCQNAVEPMSTLARAHGKEHVTCVRFLNRDTIVSVGNDGCVYTSYIRVDHLVPGWAFPVGSMTGISRLMGAPRSELQSSPLVVAGYHGNTFRVADVDHGYEYLSVDTGGRQRTLDVDFEFGGATVHSLDHRYQLAVCKAQSDGSNQLLVQQLRTAERSRTTSVRVAHGVKLHSETIFDSCFFTLGGSDTRFLATASEDCTSRISACNGGVVVDSLPLTPQQSCVRCISCSQIDDTTALLAVGGGKLVVQFFLVAPSSPGSRLVSVKDLAVRHIFKGRQGNNRSASIDHRINAIKAIPLKDDRRCHLVVAGDSNGFCHLFALPEDINDGSSKYLSAVVGICVRPILCIDIVAIDDRMMVLLGTSKGDIQIYELPGTFNPLKNEWESLSRQWLPIGYYKGHQMGTNSISATVSTTPCNENGTMTKAFARVVSGGDDQALCSAEIELEPYDNYHPKSLKLADNPVFSFFPEASLSAIKGVSYVLVNGERCVVSVGYSQQLCIWTQNGGHGDLSLTLKAKVEVDVGDINGLAAASTKSTDPPQILVVVCGLGIETFLV